MFAYSYIGEAGNKQMTVSFTYKLCSPYDKKICLQFNEARSWRAGPDDCLDGFEHRVVLTAHQL